jgi:hypothetical protein
MHYYTTATVYSPSYRKWLTSLTNVTRISRSLGSTATFFGDCSLVRVNKVNDSEPGEQLGGHEMSSLSRGDRQFLQGWVRKSYPKLKVKEIYGGFYVLKEEHNLEENVLRVFVRNDRAIVSYNPQTRRTYSQRFTQGGMGWRRRLQLSLERKIEKIWGMKNDR